MQEKIFGLFKDNICENTVVAESKEILEMMLENVYDVLEPSEDHPFFSIGDEIYNGRVRSAKPFSSWTFDEQSWSWTSPAPKPENTETETYIWDEESISWILV